MAGVGADSQQAVIAQDQHLVLTEVALEPRAFIGIQRNALVLVRRAAVIEAHGVLGQRLDLHVFER